jgi:hypothetical protein
MRALKVITPAQIRRVKTMSLSLCACLAFQLLAQNVAQARIKPADYEGPYLW